MRRSRTWVIRKVLYTNTAFDSRLKQLDRFMIWK